MKTGLVERAILAFSTRLQPSLRTRKAPQARPRNSLSAAQITRRHSGQRERRPSCLCGRAPRLFGAARRTHPGLAFSLCLAASGPSPWRCVWPPVASYGLRSRCPLCLLVICAAEREFRARACGAVLVRKEGWRRVENARIALSTRLCFIAIDSESLDTASSLRYPLCCQRDEFASPAQQQSRIRPTRSLCCKKTRCSPPSRRC